MIGRTEDPKGKREISQNEAWDKTAKMIAGYTNHGHPEILQIMVQHIGTMINRILGIYGIGMHILQTPPQCMCNTCVFVWLYSCTFQ